MFNNALREDAKTRAVANPTWLAPEVTKGNSYSEKSDVYAFGVIMHEIMTRRHPFEEFNFKLLYDARLSSHTFNSGCLYLSVACNYVLRLACNYVL